MVVQVKRMIQGCRVRGPFFPMLRKYAWKFYRREKKHCVFNGIIWKSIDGQHVEHACNILLKNNILYGSLSQADYDKIFLW